MGDQTFFIATMPSSRPSHYYLGYMQGCVFIDFDRFKSDQVILKRISFDGYGCCELGSGSRPLNSEESSVFKEILENNMDNQVLLLSLVKKAISENLEFLWEDALKEFYLI